MMINAVLVEATKHGERIQFLVGLVAALEAESAKVGVSTQDVIVVDLAKRQGRLVRSGDDLPPPSHEAQSADLSSAFHSWIASRQLADVGELPSVVDFSADSVPGLATIHGAVARWFRVKPASLSSKERTQHLAFVRQVAMYLSRKLTRLAFQEIGEQYGRDHSTAIHAVNLISRRIAADAAFKRTIEQVEAQVHKLAREDCVMRQPPRVSAAA